MSKSIPRSGKRNRPKTTVKGKRYRCASCHKRSPKPVKTPAPWYCPQCLEAREASRSLFDPYRDDRFSTVCFVE